MLHFLSMCALQTKIWHFETNDNVLIIRIWFELHTSQVCMMEKILLHDNIKVYTTMILLIIYHAKVQNLHDDKNINICQTLGTLDPKLKLNAASILLKSWQAYEGASW